MNNWVMDPRRLRLLLALSRLGSMRAVADSFNMTTSTVSQQIAALARETRTQLIEPEGRRVRLTPAGRRLAEHAVTILAALDEAQLDLDPDAEPAGTLRVGGFATGIRVSLLPVLAELATTHPRRRSDRQRVRTRSKPFGSWPTTSSIWPSPTTTTWCPRPRTPSSTRLRSGRRNGGWQFPTDAPDVVRLSDYADHHWIVNSRNTADEKAVRTLASLAGFSPHIAHQIDSLDLVEDLILAGYGVGLLPVGRPARDGLKVLALDEPSVVMTAYAVTRRGRSTWPPLRLVVDRLRPAGRRSPALESWPRATG